LEMEGGQNDAWLKETKRERGCSKDKSEKSNPERKVNVPEVVGEVLKANIIWWESQPVAGQPCN